MVGRGGRPVHVISPEGVSIGGVAMGLEWKLEAGKAPQLIVAFRGDLFDIEYVDRREVETYTIAGERKVSPLADPARSFDADG